MREAAAEADFKLMGGKPPKSGNSGNASNTAGATVSANNVGGTPADPGCVERLHWTTRNPDSL